MDISESNTVTESEWRLAITRVLTGSLLYMRAIGRNGGDIDGKLISQLADLCHNMPAILARQTSSDAYNPVLFASEIVGGILDIGQSTLQRRSIQEDLINQLPEPYRKLAHQRACKQADCS